MKVKITIEVSKEDVSRIREDKACFYPNGITDNELEFIIIDEFYNNCDDYLEDAVIIFEEGIIDG